MAWACAWLSIASILASPPASAAPTTGFELASIDGKPATLGPHLGGGRWTLVMLWTTVCVPCERQKPMIEAFHRDHAERDARVVGIAIDGAAELETVARINARHGTSYPVLVADEPRFHRDYEALVGAPLRATPTYLMYDRDGAFLAAHTGPVTRAALDAAVVGR